MEVLRIASGLWRWSCYYPEWKDVVGCVYYEASDAVVLIDPLVPSEPADEERFWGALDRDVERSGRPVHVLVTVHYHARSAKTMAKRYGAEVWSKSRARAAVARRAGRVTPLEPGDALPGGVEAMATADSSEVVYWIPAHGALVSGDVLLGDGAGGIRLCPDSWLPQGVGRAKLRDSLQPLLDLSVERVLLSHGIPVLADAWRALARALS